MLYPVHFTFLCDPLLFETFSHRSEERSVNHKILISWDLFFKFSDMYCMSTKVHTIHSSTWWW